MTELGILLNLFAEYDFIEMTDFEVKIKPEVAKFHKRIKWIERMEKRKSCFLLWK